jgi:hypothetical protein
MALATSVAKFFYASPAPKYPPAGDVGVPRGVESQVDTAACRHCAGANGRRMPGQSSAADRSVANAPRRPSRGRPRANPRGDLGFLSRCQPARRTTAMRTIEQTRNTFGIIAVNPVPQGLSFHPRVACRLLATVTLQQQRDRQHPTCRNSVLRARRRPSQIRGRQLQPNNLHCHCRLFPYGGIPRITPTRAASIHT